ncbi:two-component system OmpR family response regulator [Rhizobium tibeticum]|uniref:response regulator n=1 Tax=Rhizobium tibeticum TaxID=501024 RepID=UPI00277DDBE1|nr:response regulator transcription factor [Rhizobium tibeticum]MDP9813564.1 two-component system OmpR family response regulator [Rhizobium tibeticum]
MNLPAKDHKPLPHILIVDDDVEIRKLLKDFFQRRGLKVSLAQDGLGLLAALDVSDIDLIVLDLMLPGKSGLELCQDIRATSKIPIIMLTAVADTADRIVGLEIGADDYLSKPFDPRELLARIRAVLRRRQDSLPAAAVAPTQDLVFAGWTLDVERRRLRDPSGVRVELTRAEFNVLEALVEARGRVLSREQLIERCGGDTSQSFDRSIDILVSRLRRKLDDDPRAPSMIETVRGGGYQFVAEISAQ